MKIDHELIGDIVVLTPIGEFDSRGNQLLNRTLRSLSDREIYKVILDISMIRFVGNQTISLLLSNLKEMRAGGGDIKILNAQRAVLQYLKKNRMFELFRFYSTKAEAVKDFESLSSSNQPSASTVKYTFNPLPETKPENTTPAAQRVKTNFETGEILYANSCMLTTLIKLLQNKGILNSDEANKLFEYEHLSLKGVSDDSSST